MQKLISQEVLDWRNHPITRNFFEAADDIISQIEHELKDRNIHQDNLHRARLIGLIEGLEALKTYEPTVDENGEVVNES